MEKPECIWDAKAVHGEGVRYDPATNQVWWVDILGQKIFRLALDTGEKTTWDTREAVCCTFAAKDGSVLAAFRRSIVRLHTSDGSFETIVTVDQEPENNRLNDGTVAPDGSIWLGSMDFDFQKPSGAVYRLTSDLTVQTIDQNYTVVNGPAITPDGRRIYINDTMKGEIVCYDLTSNGAGLENRRVFAKFKEGEGLPDGLCIDAAGGLWVALVTGGKVVRYSPDGRRDREVALPSPVVTSVCLGGRDGQTLFITTSRILMDEATLAAHPLSGGLFSLQVNDKCGPCFRFG